MTKENHEDAQAVLESQDDTKKFIGEFSRMNQEAILREYEKKNRERIGKAAFEVRDNFDRIWKKITGNSYFQPVTTVRPIMPGLSERLDPASKNYSTDVVFSRIDWRRIKRKMHKKFVDLYILHGEVRDTKNSRPIYQNLTADRLRHIVGKDVAEKILLAAKTSQEGSVAGEFTISVEGYWEVIFAPMKSESDTKDVQLFCEGQALLFKRSVPTIVPGFHLAVNDHALRDIFSHEPGRGRMKIGTAQEYPCTAMREVTREEYIKRKDEGTRIMHDKIRRMEESAMQQ